MTSEEIKIKAEEMACEIADYLSSSIDDDEELKHRYIELACSFMTLACNTDKDLKAIEKEIHNYCNDIYKISLAGMARHKLGDISRVKREYK